LSELAGFTMPSDNLITPDPQPNRADAIKNRELLVATARRLFAEFGVDAVSMTAIAETAGVGKGTLYRHFENKNALCQALLDSRQRELQERTLERLRTVPGQPAANLRWFLTQVIEFVDEYAEMLCAGVQASGLPTLSHPAHVWWRMTLRGLLEQSGTVGDLDYATDTLYIMLDAHVIYYQRISQGYSLHQVIEGLFTLASRLMRDPGE
jgi:AcrR family transcriptional regulator